MHGSNRHAVNIHMQYWCKVGVSSQSLDTSVQCLTSWSQRVQHSTGQRHAEPLSTLSQINHQDKLGYVCLCVQAHVGVLRLRSMCNIQTAPSLSQPSPPTTCNSALVSAPPPQLLSSVRLHRKLPCREERQRLKVFQGKSKSLTKRFREE